jgi:hypothetical protein
VALISLQIDAVAVAAGLVRTATVGAAATVALVSLKVYAPISTASLPFGTSVVVGPGHPWKGAQRATYKEATHQPKGLTTREGAAGQGSSQLVEGALSRFCGYRLAPFPKGETRQSRRVAQRGQL